MFCFLREIEEARGERGFAKIKVMVYRRGDGSVSAYDARGPIFKMEYTSVRYDRVKT